MTILLDRDARGAAPGPHRAFHTLSLSLLPESAGAVKIPAFMRVFSSWDNAFMPLVRIDLRQGKTPEYRLKIGSAVYQAMLQTINVPEHDHFQVITDHPADGLIYDPSYLGIQRTDDIVFIQITLNAGRTLEQKKSLYAKIAELLAKDPGIRPQDVVINLVQCAKEDWSFGNGIASYAP
jgi:phenylpyruvate tautomerase PptA (4-oxalocrotonate tautomerase family)